jgi:hypothetical protein
MRFPAPLRSRDYGNPEDIVAARQAEAANKAKRAAEAETNAPVATRRTLTVRKGWHARKAAEALFDFPAGAGAVSAVPCPTPSAMRVELVD